MVNYGNYGIFLIMVNAGFISSTVGFRVEGLGVYGLRGEQALGALWAFHELLRDLPSGPE